MPWSFSKCDFDDFNGWADAADAQLRASGLPLDKYPYRVYMLPPATCPFVGLGYVGCDFSYDCRSWISGDFWGGCGGRRLGEGAGAGCRGGRRGRLVPTCLSACPPACPPACLLIDCSAPLPLLLRAATPQVVVHEMSHNLFLGHAGAYTPDGSFDE